MIANIVRNRLIPVLAVAFVCSATFAAGLSGQEDYLNRSTADLIQVLESDAETYEKAMACRALSVKGDESALSALGELVSDPQLASYARTALENIGGEGANQVLLDATSSVEGDLLIGVIASLGALGNDKSFSRLQSLVADDDQAIASAAARAMGRVGTIEAGEFLVEQLDETSGELREAIAWAALDCSDALRIERETAWANHVLQILRAKELPRKIGRAVLEATILSAGSDQEELLTIALTSVDEDVFDTALHASRELKSDATSALMDAFGDSDDSRKVRILVCLSEQADSKALPTVLNAARDENAQVREAAVGALAAYESDDVVPTIVNALGDSNEQVTSAAIRSLTKMPTDRVKPELERLLRSRDTSGVLAAIEAVARMRDSSFSGRLFVLTQNEDREIGLAATRALGSVTDVTRFRNLLMIYFARDGAQKTAANEAIGIAIARLPKEPVAEQLIKAARGKSLADQVVILEHLTALGGELALNAVVEAAQSEEDALQDAATRLLGTWASSDVAAPLLMLSKELTNNKYRIRVLRGYIRVARQLDLDLAERVELCQNALDVAERDDERALVLDVLRRNPSPGGLRVALTLLRSERLRPQAYRAVSQIANAIREDHPYDVAAILQLCRKLPISDSQSLSLENVRDQAVAQLETKTEGEEGFVPLFDGETFSGWHGGDMELFRIEDGAIIAGTLGARIEQNEFLRTDQEYEDFELRLQFKLVGEGSNAGVQIRTQEIPDDHEVSGYQADLGVGWYGCLYDESRRRKVLAGPPAALRGMPVVENDWNEYRILCEGKRIRLWINGHPTVDYLEEDDDIPLNGIIAVQVHSGAPMEASYRNIRIRELEE